MAIREIRLIYSRESRRHIMRTCKTCISPYVEEIDRLVLAGWNVKEIERLLKGKYIGEYIPSYDSLLNHSQKHVQEMINRGISSNKQRQRIITEEVKSSIMAASQLRKNLAMVSSGLESLWGDWVQSQDYVKLKEISNLISASNRSIELLLRFNSEIQESAMTEDEVFKRIMHCIHDFPTELVMKFRERWEEYGNK